MSRKKRHKHKILIDNPIITSYAAKLLLKEKYYSLDDNPRITWLNFRKKYLTEIQVKRGELRCFYCDKGPLIIEKDNNHPMIATLDHKTPRAKGGKEYDKSNLLVCCYSCNQKKKDLSFEEFIKIYKGMIPG